MKYDDWRYQNRRGWRAWWQWYKPYLVGWFIVVPAQYVTFWPHWDHAILANAVGLLLILAYSEFARRFTGAGPFKFK
jgi:hypothetical protein